MKPVTRMRLAILAAALVAAQAAQSEPCKRGPYDVSVGRSVTTLPGGRPLLDAERDLDALASAARGAGDGLRIRVDVDAPWRSVNAVASVLARTGTLHVEQCAPGAGPNEISVIAWTPR